LHWRVPFEAEQFEGSPYFYFQKPFRLACPFGEEECTRNFMKKFWPP